MLRAADWQLCRFKLEPKRSWHKNLISADTLFNASEEFDSDTDEAFTCDDALSSQADEAIVFNEVSSRGWSPQEDWTMFGRTATEEDNTSASAALAINSRKEGKSIFDVTIDTGNTLIEQRQHRLFC